MRSGVAKCMAVAVGAIGAFSAPWAAADTALTVTGGTNKNDYGGSVGYSFTVGNAPITVTSLGYYNGINAGTDYLANGASHQVAIYNDTTHALLGSVATITGDANTVSAAGDGQFAYIAVTPFALAANTTYDISASNLSSSTVTTGKSFYLVKATGVSTGTDITYGTSRFAGSSSTVEFPSNSYGTNDVGNIGGNFQYTAPEPASLTLIGAGALALLQRRRRSAAI